MKLFKQLLIESGANLDLSFTVVPGFGGYFKGVKRVIDFSAERVVLSVAKKQLTVTGENLSVDKFFQQDLFLRGDVRGISFE